MHFLVSHSPGQDECHVSHPFKIQRYCCDFASANSSGLRLRTYDSARADDGPAHSNHRPVTHGGFTRSNRHPKGRTDCGCPPRDGHPLPTHGKTSGYSHTRPYRGSRSYFYSRAHGDTGTNANTNSYRNSDTHAHTGAHGDTGADTHSCSNCDAHADTKSNSRSHGNARANGNT